eukprot:NODE_7048_length_797_cov_159.615727_g6809_i0.p1 GENE.NODE_7048_length_797_cov_159.615727_g6809_i0~~NODE_7048_length_797_cov_159.615727_g6809_i0.p1  ORF type:complete len:189 (-),score=43.59 NODE_7048_length_797_cov_159.615727_g6809_i0:230-742(-)
MSLGRALGSVLRTSAVTRGRSGSNLYNRVMGNTRYVYLEALYGGDEVLDHTPHSSDGADSHSFAPNVLVATNEGRTPYDARKLGDALTVFLGIWGILWVWIIAQFLAQPKVFKHFWETLTLQYQYERVYGEEYFIKIGPVHGFYRSPLEKLGLIKSQEDYRNDLDYPDDL